MKNFKFLAAFALAAGLFACSTDEAWEEQPKPGNGEVEAYTTIRVAMPGSSMSRATDAENGDGEEVGTEAENKVNSVSLYFFKAEKLMGDLKIAGTEFTKKEGEEVIYESKAQVVKFEGSNLSVYAVVNGEVPGLTEATTLKEFLSKTVKTADATKAGNMLMTSRTPGAVSISAAENNTAEKAAVLNVSVERTAAKIDFKSTMAENKYDVKEETSQETVAEVTFTDYKIVNQRNDAYFFRKVGSEAGVWGENYGSGIQTGDNYVLDPYFTQKTVEAAGATDFTATWFGTDKAYAADSDTYTALPTATDPTLLTYSMENTMKQDCQLNGYSTGIIFKASFKPVKVYAWSAENETFEKVDYAGGDFYRYNDVLYRTKQEIIDHYKAAEDQIDTYTADENGGVTSYYSYWIRHQNNSDNSEMGIMEFAIVRNNAYKLDIASVSGIGEPDDDITPPTPDEKKKMYLKVNVTILPWVVRNNSIDL